MAVKAPEEESLQSTDTQTFAALAEQMQKIQDNSGVSADQELVVSNAWILLGKTPTEAASATHDDEEIEDLVAGALLFGKLVKDEIDAIDEQPLELITTKSILYGSCRALTPLI